MIEFALNWYDVPTLVQKLILDYYEKLADMVVTREWSAGFGLVDVGPFQAGVRFVDNPD